MRDDPGPRLLEHDGAEMVVGMMVGQHQPAHGRGGRAADGPEEPLAVARARQRIDDDDPGGGDDEPGVGAPFDAPAGVSHDREHARRELPRRKSARVGRESGRGGEQGAGEQELDDLASFFEWVSKIDTQGWPPNEAG